MTGIALKQGPLADLQETRKHPQELKYKVFSSTEYIRYEKCLLQWILPKYFLNRLPSAQFFFFFGLLYTHITYTEFYHTSKYVKYWIPDYVNKSHAFISWCSSSLQEHSGLAKLGVEHQDVLSFNPIVWHNSLKFQFVHNS